MWSHTLEEAKAEQSCGPPGGTSRSQGAEQGIWGMMECLGCGGDYMTLFVKTWNCTPTRVHFTL